MPPRVSVRVTTPPGSPVPVMVGLVWLVMPSPMAPLSDGSASASDPGAGGAPVSMVSVSVPVFSDTLPATSVVVAMMVCLPSASGVAGVKLHRPRLLATAVPRLVNTPPCESVRVMVAPASVKPPMAGVTSLVMRSPRTPLSEDSSSAMTGALGGSRSMVRLKEDDGSEMLPAASVEKALM